MTQKSKFVVVLPHMVLHMTMQIIQKCNASGTSIVSNCGYSHEINIATAISHAAATVMQIISSNDTVQMTRTSYLYTVSTLIQ